VVDSDGIELYAERRGDGSPLLFISGTGSALAVPPGGFDTPFAAEFDMVCYDQRGLGRSGRPAATSVWTMADYGNDAAAVLDWAGWDQAAVMGVSFGGMVAQELLIRHPERVSRAVLACTSSGGAGGSSYPLHELADLPPAARADAMMGLIDTRWAGSAGEATIRDYLNASFEAAGAPDVGARAQLEARRHHDTFARLGEVATPVLVCAGRYDGIAPLANSEAIATSLANSHLAVFDGGHAFLQQDPTSIQTIRDFLL
jgi:3-oxoadipate enol-lactonase